MNITTHDHKRIREAVRQAETRTSGEIFCVIARASDDYAAFPLLWAGLAALALPLPLLLVTPLTANQIYYAQLALFVALSLVLWHGAVRYRIVPAHIKHRRARRNAFEQFLAHGLHTTRERTGVLLFISLAEHHAEVVADEAIHTEVDGAVWERAVDALVSGARTSNLGEGFVNAITITGDVLAQHFPPQPQDANELPDHLVIL